jgi:hypothetical protein
MSKATHQLTLPLSIKKAAQRLAKEDGLSLNRWIAVAVAEKVGVVETAAEFFKKRAGRATGEGLMKFLRTAPKVAPDPEDTLRLASAWTAAAGWPLSALRPAWHC